MSLGQVIRGLADDLDDLNGLYSQLRDVPGEVDELVGRHLLGTLREKLSVAIELLTKRECLDNAIEDSPVFLRGLFDDFRSHLMDLELMLNPEQYLHHSGAGAQNKHSVPWDRFSHGNHQEFCLNFRQHVVQLESNISELLTQLDPTMDLSTEADDIGVSNFQSPSLSSLKYFALRSHMTSVGSSPASRLSSPRDGRATRCRRSKTEDEMIFDRFVQQYAKAGPSGKRKRVDEGEAPLLVGIESLSKHLPFPFPAGEADIKKMEQQIRSTIGSDNDDIPEWNLDDMKRSLPEAEDEAILPRTPASGPSAVALGKRKTVSPSLASTIHLTEYASSRSGSIGSALTDGSVYSISSHDRVYEAGTCTLWHRQGATGLVKVDIMRTEVRRAMQPFQGRQVVAITIVSKTPSGQEIPDRLFMPTLGVNSSPFLEHMEVVHAFQRHDPHAHFIVRFAPNPAQHPQYSFSNQDACWEFLQSITEKFLCASVDIESIKSAVTHGNTTESGVATLQVWEDRQTSRRSIQFFRNKNSHARQRVIEIDVENLMPPRLEKKTGKMIIELRHQEDPSTKELKYLKIDFSSPDFQERFLCEGRFKRPVYMDDLSGWTSNRASIR